MLSSKRLHLAGSPDSLTQNGSASLDNFRGCMKKVVYTADNVRLDLVELAIRKHDLISVHGKVLFNRCEDLRSSQPITFMTENAVISVPGVRDLGSIQFQFRTNEPNGLLLYGVGIDGNNGIFIIEILDGFIYFVLDLGSGLTKVKALTGPVNDSSLHFVTLEHNSGAGVFTVDRKPQHYNISALKLTLKGELYVGGISDNRKVSDAIKYSRLNRGYVGCMLHLVVDGGNVDLAALAMEQRQEGVGRYCRSSTPHCMSQPCHHRGVCQEGWNRYTCSCVNTNYTGDTCREGMSKYTFDICLYTCVCVCYF
ncbi:hypothetical protein NP493_7741g00002 [Ridgeia piscesae]|uniref:Uncharacterized protein n=1 Tax=Ridgeia piscesae TaxID=27915 RepID=A0AAD9ML01_RIDPI|nr:hypothetical protein NP493_7741g00002 [Ridgeia piscesae]